MSVVQYIGADDLTITDAYGRHTYRAPNGPASVVFYVDSEHPHVLAHPTRFRPAPTGRGGARAFAERDRSRSSATLSGVTLGGVHVKGRDLRPELYSELLAAVQRAKGNGVRVGPIRHQRTTNPQLVRSRAEHRARQGSEGRCVYRGVVERSAGIRPKALDEVRQFQRRDRGKELGGIVFVASWPSSGDAVRGSRRCRAHVPARRCMRTGSCMTPIGTGGRSRVWASTGSCRSARSTHTLGGRGHRHSRIWISGRCCVRRSGWTT